MQIRPYRWLALAGLGLLAACGQPTQTTNFGEVANQPHDHTAATQTAGQAHTDHAAASASTLQPVLATSEVVVGPNRVALGLLQDNVPIKDAPDTKVKVRYYKLNGNQATLAGQEDARYYGEGLGPRGTFVIHPTFNQAGTWGMEVDAQRPGQPVVTQRMSIEVTAKGSAPMIGQAAPRSDTPTAADVPDLQSITSATEPDTRLYQMSVADALASGKPSMILFATPGYCQTQVCGPGVEVESALAEKFGDQVNAVHVEIYKLPYTGEFVPAMQEWGLQSEPWLFLVDKNGTIVGRYEGGITLAELEPAVAKLVQ